MDYSMQNNTGGGFYFNNPGNINTPQDKGKKKEPARTQTVIPATICQVRDHPDDEFKLFGMSTQILKFVAIVRDIRPQSTKATYMLEDHTGMISALWWLESDGNSEPALPDVKIGTYVKVYGSVRVQDNEKVVMILRISPVENINEVTTHLLEVIQIRLEAEAMSKGRGIKADLKAMIRSNNPSGDLVNSMMNISDAGTQNIAQPMGTLEQQVSKFLQTASNKHGHNRQIIYQHFSNYSAKDISNALEFLIQEGHAYTTIDNDHFMTSTEFS